jgi:cob(I)alamin adenosyltransferase
MTSDDAMRRIDVLLSHVWMVRAFLKHCDEVEDDEELQQVHRGLYDYMLALGAPLQAGDSETYLKLARKKLSKLKKNVELFAEIQPEVSGHTNFVMAAASLQAAVSEVERVLAGTPG